MTCPICNGSGERDGEYGLLSCDAPNCTAATERAALEAANKAAEPMTVYDQRWFAYGIGKQSSVRSRVEAAAHRLIIAVENLGHAEGGLSGRDELEKACDQLEAMLKDLV